MDKPKVKKAERALIRREIHPIYGMIEPAPRGFRWNDPRSIADRANGFSWCLACGGTWGWLKSLATPAGKVRGCFPICTDCGMGMTVEEILKILKRHDEHAAGFCPMAGPKGILDHEPMDLEYARRALEFWVRNREPGEDPEQTCHRLRYGE